MPKLLVCGAVNWDTTIFVERLPLAGEEIEVEKLVSIPGGKGANTAVAAARILGKDQVGLIGMIGSDAVANAQEEILRNEGVDISCVSRHATAASGQAFVIVERGGENMIMTHRAANMAITKEVVSRDDVVSAIQSAAMMIVIDPPLEVATEIAAKSMKTRSKVLFSPATLANEGIEMIEYLLRSADYVALNEHESQLLTSEDDGRVACEKLSKLLGGTTVITTLGRKGSAISSNGSNEFVPSVDPGLFGLKVVSTVGAGDTFVGSFASFKLLGKSDLEAIFLASVAASMKTTQEQTRASLTFDEIMLHAQSEVLLPL